MATGSEGSRINQQGAREFRSPARDIRPAAQRSLTRSAPAGSTSVMDARPKPPPSAARVAELTGARHAQPGPSRTEPSGQVALPNRDAQPATTSGATARDADNRQRNDGNPPAEVGTTPRPAAETSTAGASPARERSETDRLPETRASQPVDTRTPQERLNDTIAEAGEKGIDQDQLERYAMALGNNERASDRELTLTTLSRRTGLPPHEVQDLVRSYERDKTRTKENGPLYHYHQISYEGFGSAAEDQALKSYNDLKDSGKAPRSSGWAPHLVLTTRDKYDKEGNLKQPGLQATGVGAKSHDVALVFDESIMDSPEYDCTGQFPNLPRIPLTNLHAALVKTEEEIPGVQKTLHDNGLDAKVMTREEWERRIYGKGETENAPAIPSSPAQSEHQVFPDASGDHSVTGTPHEQPGLEPVAAEIKERYGLQADTAAIQAALGGYEDGQRWVLDKYGRGDIPRTAIGTHPENLSGLTGLKFTDDGELVIAVDAKQFRQLDVIAPKETVTRDYGQDVPVRPDVTVQEQFEALGVEGTLRWMQAQGENGLALPDQEINNPAQQKEGLALMLEPQETEILHTVGEYFQEQHGRNPYGEVEKYVEDSRAREVERQVRTTQPDAVPLPTYDPDNQIRVSTDTPAGPMGDPVLTAVVTERTRAERQLAKETGTQHNWTVGRGLEWAIDHLAPEVGMHYQAHGFHHVKGFVDIDRILTEGIKKRKKLYTTNLVPAVDPALIAANGEAMPYTTEGIWVITDYIDNFQGQELTTEDIRYVVVDAVYSGAIDVIQKRYPEVKVVPWHDAPKVLTERANEITGANYTYDVLTTDNMPDLMPVNDELPGTRKRSSSSTSQSSVAPAASTSSSSSTAQLPSPPPAGDLEIPGPELGDVTGGSALPDIPGPEVSGSLPDLPGPEISGALPDVSGPGLPDIGGPAMPALPVPKLPVPGSES